MLALFVRFQKVVVSHIDIFIRRKVFINCIKLDSNDIWTVGQVGFTSRWRRARCHGNPVNVTLKNQVQEKSQKNFSQSSVGNRQSTSQSDYGIWINTWIPDLGLVSNIWITSVLAHFTDIGLDKSQINDAKHCLQLLLITRICQAHAAWVSGRFNPDLPLSTITGEIWSGTLVGTEVWSRLSVLQIQS